MAGVAADAQTRRRPVEATPAFKPREGAGTAKLQIATRSLADTSERRQPVTDLLLRIPAAAIAGAASELTRSPRPSAGASDARDGFAVELIVAAGGRIYAEERAQCSPWASDLSRCRARCDGGGFVLARMADGNGVMLQLILGEAALDAGHGAGFKFAACDDAGRSETVLVPVRGTPIARVDLTAD